MYLDAVIGRIVEACKKHNYTILVTADHGNAEQMLDSEGKPHTAHTTNKGMKLISTKKVFMVERSFNV